MMHPARQAYVEEAEEVSSYGLDNFLRPLITNTYCVQERGMTLDEVPMDRDYDMPSASAGMAPEKASAILSQFERKRRAATMAVPTDDVECVLNYGSLGSRSPSSAKARQIDETD